MRAAAIGLFLGAVLFASSASAYDPYDPANCNGGAEWDDKGAEWGDKRVLVVSKVGPADTCHVAYIDALANSDAIALARHVADTQAKAFDCRGEPRAEGAGGKSPM